MEGERGRDWSGTANSQGGPMMDGQSSQGRILPWVLEGR